MREEVVLLPCPFCGSEAGWAPDNRSVKVHCSNEDCEAETGPWYRKGDAGELAAIANWNTRVTDHAALTPRDYSVAGERVATGWRPIEMGADMPYTERELLAAMVLEHDAGGITLRTLGEARRAVSCAAGGWQPIETAPRDGVTFDIWVPCEDGGYRITDVQFSAHGLLIKGGGPAELPRWPTHWMPLPPAPETGA